MEELQNLQAGDGLDESQIARMAQLEVKIEQLELAEKTAAEAKEAEAKSNLLTASAKELKSALAQKEHYRAKLEKLEAEKKALEGREPKSVLDVEDYIGISAALEGLDKREKEYLAQQHKLTGKSLSEIRGEEDFLLWQSAYKQKVEKEKALAPSNRQQEAEKPQSLLEKLRGTSREEKEKLLAERGLWKPPKIRPDRVKIGNFA